MQLTAFLISLLLWIGCTSKNKESSTDDIISVELAQSYKFDFTNNTYTVLFISKPPVEIKLNLTEGEKRTIIDKYKDLEIDEIITRNMHSDEILIEDECLVMPKIFTVLSVKRNNSIYEIRIDEDCDDFFFSNFRNADAVKEFLGFVQKMIKSKPELKNAPLSDIIYM